MYWQCLHFGWVSNVKCVAYFFVLLCPFVYLPYFYSKRKTTAVIALLLFFAQFFCFISFFFSFFLLYVYMLRMCISVPATCVVHFVDKSLAVCAKLATITTKHCTDFLTYIFSASPFSSCFSDYFLWWLDFRLFNWVHTYAQIQAHICVCLCVCVCTCSNTCV